MNHHGPYPDPPAISREKSRHGEERLQVSLQATKHDAALIRQIGSGLIDAGIVCHVGQPVAEDAAVILILTPEGVAARAGVWPTHTGRLVPVVCGKVDDTLVPEDIRALNWNSVGHAGSSRSNRSGGSCLSDNRRYGPDA